MKKSAKQGLLFIGIILVLLLGGCARNSEQVNQSIQEDTAVPTGEVVLDENQITAADGEIIIEAESETTNSKTYQIGVIQLVEHKSLDTLYKGFVDQLDALDISYELDFQNAQNDPSMLKTIAQRFTNNNVDLILAIATPAVQAVAEETTTIPILGAAVTDYMSVNLIDSNEHPGGNISGTTDSTPVEKQLTLIPIVRPDAKTVGLLYTASEANSKIQIDKAIKVLDEQNTDHKEYAITSSNDIQAMMQTMKGKVDVIYTPTDNTIASAMDAIAQESIALDIPVIVGATDMVTDGGTITYGLNYYNMGKQTADMAKRILVDGEDISSMPIENSTINEFAYNKEIGDQLGIQLPPELLE